METPMGDDPRQQRSEEDAELEREIRQERKFSLGEAIGRLAGPGAMKGASPLSLLQQADLQVAACLQKHLTDSGGGELRLLLRREVQESDILLQHWSSRWSLWLSTASGRSTRSACSRSWFATPTSSGGERWASGPILSGPEPHPTRKTRTRSHRSARPCRSCSRVCPPFAPA